MHLFAMRKLRLDYMISDITTHSGVKFSDVILFDKEEM